MWRESIGRDLEERTEKFHQGLKSVLDGAEANARVDCDMTESNPLFLIS